MKWNKKKGELILTAQEDEDIRKDSARHIDEFCNTKRKKHIFIVTKKGHINSREGYWIPNPEYDPKYVKENPVGEYDF